MKSEIFIKVKAYVWFSQLDCSISSPLDGANLGVDLDDRQSADLRFAGDKFPLHNNKNDAKHFCTKLIQKQLRLVFMNSLQQQSSARTTKTPFHRGRYTDRKNDIFLYLDGDIGCEVRKKEKEKHAENSIASMTSIFKKIGERDVQNLQYLF